MSERVLITGGAGFLGLHLAAALAPEAEVVLLDSLQHNPARQREAVRHFRARLVEADVLDAAAVRGAVRGVERAVHLASLAGVDRVSKAPLATMETVLQGTRNVLQACADAGVARVVCASTSEVYGARAERVTEEQLGALPPEHPRFAYAAAKLAAEHLAFAFRHERGLSVTVVRPFNAYGPGQLGQGAVREFAARAVRGQALEIRGSGTEVRAWCFVADLVEGLRSALRAPLAEGRIYNLGNPAAAVTVRALAERVVTLAGSDSPIVYVPAPGPDVLVRVPDIGRARTELGFAPAVGLDEGLRQTIAAERALLGGGP